jgi:hypothetical protein
VRETFVRDILHLRQLDPKYLAFERERERFLRCDDDAGGRSLERFDLGVNSPAAPHFAQGQKAGTVSSVAFQEEKGNLAVGCGCGWLRKRGSHSHRRQREDELAFTRETVLSWPQSYLLPSTSLICRILVIKQSPNLPRLSPLFYQPTGNYETQPMLSESTSSAFVLLKLEI